MKRIAIMIILFFIMLSSCDDFRGNLQDTLTDIRYSKISSGFKLTYLEEWESLESYIEVANWIRVRIKYVADPGYDVWRGPARTLELGYGDCDDIALLFMNICYVAFGVKPELVLVYVRHVESGGMINHAEVRIDGLNYSIYSGYSRVADSGYSYSFDHVYGL